MDILRNNSIYQNQRYLKFKHCNQQSVEYNTLKNDLHIFNCILKKAIQEAKIQVIYPVQKQYKENMANHIGHNL